MPTVADEMLGRLRERRAAATSDWHRMKQQARTRWYLRHCAKVGRGAVVRGKPTVDAIDLQIGHSFKIWSGYRTTLITGWGRIRIGDRVAINSGTLLFSVAEIEIGDDVGLALETYIMDTDHHGMEGGPTKQAPIRIGSGTWVGSRVMILPGVTVGSRCVIAPCSVVSQDVPDDTLVAGYPARVVRKLVYPDGINRAWHHDQATSMPQSSLPVAT